MGYIVILSWIGVAGLALAGCIPDDAVYMVSSISGGLYVFFLLFVFVPFMYFCTP